jgi:hypothetical protein
MVLSAHMLMDDLDPEQRASVRWFIWFCLIVMLICIAGGGYWAYAQSRDDGEVQDAGEPADGPPAWQELSAAVRLDQPLGDRVVVDGVTGQPMPRLR